MNRPFATIVRKSKSSGYGNEEKLVYLLEKLNLTDRIVGNKDGIEKVLPRKINFTETKKTIQSERKEANDYLKGELICTQN